MRTTSVGDCSRVVPQKGLIGFTEGSESVIPLVLSFKALAQLIPGDAPIDRIADLRDQIAKCLFCLGIFLVASSQDGASNLRSLIGRINLQRLGGPNLGLIKSILAFE